MKGIKVITLSGFPFFPDVFVQTSREQIRCHRSVENTSLRRPNHTIAEQRKDLSRTCDHVPGSRLRTPDHQSGIPRKAVPICLRHRVRTRNIRKTACILHRCWFIQGSQNFVFFLVGDLWSKNQKLCGMQTDFLYRRDFM